MINAQRAALNIQYLTLDRRLLFILRDGCDHDRDRVSYGETECWLLIGNILYWFDGLMRERKIIGESEEGGVGEGIGARG